VEGAARAKVERYTDRAEYYEADAVVLADTRGEASKRKRWRAPSSTSSRTM
jgi:hypothetical protein